MAKGWRARSWRLYVTLSLTTAFFFVELIVGNATNSTTLVADSFHMLSDIFSLIIGITAIRFAKRSSTNNTFGWVRMEILGALVNAVFLIALCFSIIIDAITRMIKVEGIEDSKLVLIVGSIGLGINIIGLFLFHGVSSHGHSHSHGHGHGPTNDAADEEGTVKVDGGAEVPHVDDNHDGHGHTHGDHGHSHSHGHGTPPTAPPPNANSANANTQPGGTVPKASKDGSLNMRGVYLHILGDALGSIVVIISALINMFAPEWNGIVYVDPVLSLVIAAILLFHSFPLAKSAGLILLEAVPSFISTTAVANDLVKIPGVEAIHELHIWQLADERMMATVHVFVRDPMTFMQAASAIKQLFHRYGVHATTVQPEVLEAAETDESFVPLSGAAASSDQVSVYTLDIPETTCLLPCQTTTGECTKKTCCMNHNAASARVRSRRMTSTAVDSQAAILGTSGAEQ